MTILTPSALTEIEKRAENVTSGDGKWADRWKVFATHAEGDIRRLISSHKLLEARVKELEGAQMPVEFFDHCLGVIQEMAKDFQASASFAEEILLALGQLNAGRRAASALKGEG